MALGRSISNCLAITPELLDVESQSHASYIAQMPDALLQP